MKCTTNELITSLGSCLAVDGGGDGLCPVIGLEHECLEVAFDSLFRRVLVALFVLEYCRV